MPPSSFVLATTLTVSLLFLKRQSHGFHLLLLGSFYAVCVQCRRSGGGGQGDRALPNDCLCPPFRFAQNTFLERHLMTSQQAIMEKEIITLKENSRLKFSRFFAKLLATNCFYTTQYVNVRNNPPY